MIFFIFFIFIHGKDLRHKSRFQISAVLFLSPRASIQTSILIQRHTKPLENYTKHTHSAFKEHFSLECSEYVLMEAKFLLKLPVT